jgi:hypothetical protein
MRYLAWFTLSAICSLTSASNLLHKFGTDGHAILCVSDSDMDPDLLRYNNESTDLQVGRGRTPGFGFLIDAKSMAGLLKGFRTKPEFKDHPYVNQLSGSIDFLGADDQRRLGSAMRARDLEDAWYSRGRCLGREIRHLGDTGLTEVKCASGDNYSSVWNRPPVSGVSMPSPNSFVVAACEYETLQMGPYAGDELRNCSRILNTDGFLIDYRFQEENADLIPQIDSLLLHKVSEWKKNCLVVGGSRI